VTEVTTNRLEQLEAKAKEALEKMYQGAVGAREFAEAMRDIKNGEHFLPQYQSFRQYYIQVSSVQHGY
jgi:hypothetical protein